MDFHSYISSKNYTDQRVTELTGLNYSDVNTKLDNLLSTPRTKSWVATDGQLLYPLGATYLTGQITIYIDGIPQISGVNFSETSPSSITLLCNASDVIAGMNVVAVYK